MLKDHTVEMPFIPKLSSHSVSIYIRLYQLKVDVGVLNAVKNALADVLSVRGLCLTHSYGFLVADLHQAFADTIYTMQPLRPVYTGDFSGDFKRDFAACKLSPRNRQ